MSSGTRTVRLRVSPEVARVVGKGAPRELQLQAAAGEVPLSPGDLVTVLFFLRHGADPEVKERALETLRRLPASSLAAVLGDAGLAPQLLDFVARARPDDPAVMTQLLAHPALGESTLLHLAARAGAEVLVLLARDPRRLRATPGLAEAILANPNAGPGLRTRLGEAPPQVEEVPADEENMSKYQLALEMGVAEKIKMALTGDKEWRGIFLKDANKLVSSAVLKNPRITDGEVLAVAKNKSAHDEMIRLITLNQEWIKNYEVKKALVIHPRTPLPKALRYMNVLTEKDLKVLAKSRGVSQVIVNNARRMLLAKQKDR